MNGHTSATLLGEKLGHVRMLSSLIWQWEARFKGVEFRGKATFIGRPLISVAHGSKMVLSDGVRLYSALRANPLACFQPCVLRTVIPGASLFLGPAVGLSGTVLCAGSAIEIGEGTIFGSGALVLDNDFHWPAGEWGWATDEETCRRNAQPVKIGRGVFVGARAIILKGVTIGDRAAVGAGAVVTKDVPAGHVAVGNPARVFRSDVAGRDAGAPRGSG
jgi:acetyltransferase-like isoleucine patch superfamily enzyme